MTYDGTMPQIDTPELPQYGENIARTLAVNSFVSCSSVAKAIYKNIRFLRQLRINLEAKHPEGETIPTYIEWLLDNFYLAQREGLSAAGDLKSYKKLPASDNIAVLFSLCKALIRSGDGKVTPERSELFLQGCQQVYILSRRELLRFVPFLKAAAVSELAELYASELDGDFAARTAEKLFSTLRALSTLDFSKVIENVDKTEQLLKQDPAGIYPEMSEKTRGYYKKRVAMLSRAYRVSEHRIAQRVLELSQNSEKNGCHVGHWLFTRPMNEDKPSRSGAVYIAVNILLTLILSILTAFVLRSIAAALLLLVPFSELVKTVVDCFLLWVTPPAHVPRMELENGLPPAGRTICVISALLASEHSGAVLARRLEEFRFASRDCGDNLIFGILADLPEAKTKVTADDEKKISACKDAIDALNKKYGGGFFFFIRERTYNKSDNIYTAWERKRGAVTELAWFLGENGSSLSCISGNRLSLRGVRYILTLDEDTRLTPGSAKELIGAMLHPLNSPVIDENTNKVVSGHAVIHPRISVELSSSNRSFFSRVFAGHGGTDPYGSDSSELYMDVFDNGGFAGKGIIDISAFTKCMSNRIPENRVLSHDALEGAYLRGAYMGDAELTDTFPADILSYYKRLHRWTRGDWQNLPWLFRKGKALTDIDRFRLFDSARRSLVAPITLITFISAFFFPSTALTIAALAALFSIALRLISTAIRSLFRDEQELKQRCHSPMIRGVREMLLQTELKLILLPYEAYISLISICTALWRMAISHTGLLSWTPASVFEGNAQGNFKYIRSMWFASLLGLILAFFAPSIIGKASGIIWLFSPLLAASISKITVKQLRLSPEDKSYLFCCAKKIWSFFEDFCTADDNYLPPDNWQESPPAGIAHRTSPTNIGLCLLSCISAVDLDIASQQAAFGIIENILATLRRMSKWNGHLYNWYDTQTLRPLHPAYVSTVDSGNLAACLIILREALKEYDCPELAACCDELLLPMSFIPLYDEAHHLFSIGIDTDKEKITDSFYDLMASEARTTGYIAIARGDVKRRHWRSLSRAQVENDGYRGMVSWTGSMFEYLMPRLFFKSTEGSLIYETIRFAVGVQKRRGKLKKLPWGISESAFYALDPALNYRYKAHGCGALALKRNMNSEYVVSPYSSFLALCCGAKSVVENLRRLEKFGALGKYGFWEAVDFTDDRALGRNGEIVRCVMAHHQGMSLISIANTLRSNIMPNRLMRDPSMAAHASLLDEKLPLGGVLLRRVEKKPPEKPPRTSSIFWSKRGNTIDFNAPVCCLLSNGKYSIMSTNSGVCKSIYNGISPYFTSSDLPSYQHGIELLLKRENTILPLLPSPEHNSKTKYSWDFSFSGARIETKTEDLSSEVLISVSDSSNGEKRVISVSTDSEGIQSCELCVMFEPVLARTNDYVNHPAFYKLGLHAKMSNGALIIRRVERKSVAECFLCLAASSPMELSVRRTLVPGRGGLASAIDANVPSPLGWLSDPLICAKIPIRLSKSTPATVTIAIAIGETEIEAYTSANSILTGGDSDSACFPSNCASRLRLSEEQAENAMELLNSLIYPKLKSSKNGIARREFWRFGISGSLPIITHSVSGEDDTDEAEALIKQHSFLKALDCPFDLVLLTNEGGNYLRPAAGALCELRRTVGLECPHIHIIDRSANAECLIESSAAPRIQNANSGSTSYIMSTYHSGNINSFPEYAWDSNEAFFFYVNHSLPPRCWGNMLTNGRFGFFATDCGTGHMWYKNAREFHINRWLCDSVTTRGTEIFELSGHSLFASPDDTDCKVSFGFGYAKWEKTIEGRKVTATAFVPMDTDARVILVECDDSDTLHLRWSSGLVLCGDDSSASLAKIEKKGGTFIVESPESPFPDAKFVICSSGGVTGYTSDRNLWFQGKTDDNCETGGFIGISIEATAPFVFVCGCDDEKKLFELCSPFAAKDSLKSTIISWKHTLSAIKIKTSFPSLDHLVNGWAAYQALACRVMGRCSIYQSGGATGFRDQLQDAVNLILLDSSYARAQILESCSHQYLEGDVMHWWHTLECETKGVRTRCSDDLLWLPWALCEYVEKTGDIVLCKLTAPWLCSPPLRSDEHDRYEIAAQTNESAEVIVHAKRAMEMILSRGTGEHGLLKIGNGDWNDGMDMVGARDRGESVWLTWFFSHTAARFSQLLRSLGDTEDADKYEKASIALGKSANDAWDGQWFLRGWYDDGTPLGSKSQACCQIDSIAQSFSSLSDSADKARVNQALSSALERLFDKKAGIIRLFDPPFENADPSPGYIESYGPSFRENGGQYTHGAVWLAMALLHENRSDEAAELINALIPDNRDGAIYEAEPFVLSADIYSNPDCLGKAGWSWYTGSAGWFYRVVTEDLLGIKMVGGEINLSPKLPKSWGCCELTLLDKDGNERKYELSSEDAVQKG